MGYCGQGTTNDDCSSAQTYCKINGQLVSDQPNLISTFSILQNELSTTEKWQQIKDILFNIYNFGNLGTRNPINIDNISGIDQNNIIYLTIYNNIIDSLQTGINNININNGNKITNGQLISKTLLDNLQTYISNYKLNPDRCASCNTDCNATCYGCNSCYAVCENADCAWYCQGCNGGCYGCYGCDIDDSMGCLSGYKG